MGSDANRLRRKWQDYSGQNASVAEKDFFSVFKYVFKDTEFRIRRPNEFRNEYLNFKLSDEELKEIYIPPEGIKKHGFAIDYAIDNIDTKKTIYVEIKRQDGWVEGGKRTDGRGNAHERSCKFFTPGLLKILRNKGNLTEEVLPFWAVFQGAITRDPCRVREIKCWYNEYTANYFFWRDSNNPEKLIAHFEENIVPIIS